MRIAIPLANGRLSSHFGHCHSFAMIDIDPQGKEVVRRTQETAPPHEPGLLPAWLGERGAKVIIAAGMGQRAQQLFEQQGIQVVVGAADDTPENLVKSYLAGTLKVGSNICSH